MRGRNRRGEERNCVGWDYVDRGVRVVFVSLLLIQLQVVGVLLIVCREKNEWWE